MVWRACGHHIVLYDWLATLEAAFRCQGFCLPPTLEVVLYRIASFVSSYPPGVGVAPSAYGARKLPPATHLGGPRLWQRYKCPTTTTAIFYLLNLVHISNIIYIYTMYVASKACLPALLAYTYKTYIYSIRSKKHMFEIRNSKVP